MKSPLSKFPFLSYRNVFITTDFALLNIQKSNLHKRKYENINYETNIIGNVIKECELLEALEKNWIREAILDVFDTGNGSLNYNDFTELLT